MYGLFHRLRATFWYLSLIISHLSQHDSVVWLYLSILNDLELLHKSQHFCTYCTSLEASISRATVSERNGLPVITTYIGPLLCFATVGFHTINKYCTWSHDLYPGPPFQGHRPRLRTVRTAQLIKPPGEVWSDPGWCPVLCDKMCLHGSALHPGFFMNVLVWWS